ncbi:MAG: CBS domain-containing protein [Deltaproteobacteria bacterium]|nr:CBS domain-containing protein [Deltaproteobacteria bacterium]
MTVGELCTREVVVAEKEMGVVAVAQLMRSYAVGDVVVVEHRNEQVFPLGIITDRDIVVELIAEEVALDAVSVGDVMSYELVTVPESEDVWSALELMRWKGIRRIPVINADGSLEGIVAFDDLLELLAEELAMLARVASRGDLSGRRFIP